ncbi:MAG: NAD-dependent epimerase/dehydratase family protein [Chromatocurvus sp.]
MKCLVTGPTGFIGRALCQALTAAGHDVTGLLRRADPSPACMPHLSHDLREALPDTLSLRGFDAVFHVAGVAHRRAPAACHSAVNERASIALAQRAARDGVRRFVFLSSVKAMGCTGAPVARAETESEAPIGAYAVSKRRAEMALVQLAGESALEVVVLRPALVYGAGVGGNLAALVSWVRRGLPMVPEVGARSMVSRDDLVRLLVALAGTTVHGLPPDGAVWNVTDDQAYSTHRLMLALSSAMRRPVSRLVMPVSGWRILGACADLQRRAPIGTTASALLGDELYDSRAVGAATGWQPRQCFEDVAPAIVRAAAVAR